MSSEGTFKLSWTEAATRDMEEIVGYIAIESAVNARRLLARLRQRAAALETLPARGRVVPELALLGIVTWRELIVKPYRIVYRIEGRAVQVIAVFDGRRDLDDVLLDRMFRTP